MRILFISKECAGISLAYKLVEEANEVKLYVQQKGFEKVGKGFGIRKVGDWRNELSWVGEKGLIVFDYTGFGKLQDDLRKQGYSIVGSSEDGDRLELERDYSHTILKSYGLKSIPLRHFTAGGDAIKFIEKTKSEWVIKHNGCVDKTVTYVGKMPDGCDVVDVLKNDHKYNRKECKTVVLQKKINGVEIAVARFFNGREWVGPVEMAVEHKKLFPGDLGPKTDEMGTLMWYDGASSNRLFQETLSKLGPFLMKVDFRGKVDINCIVNEEGAFPLEVTARFGYPAMDLQNVFFLSPWSQFLKAVADRKHFDVKFSEGYGIVVQIAVPPFPYANLNKKYNPEGLKIYFQKELTEEEWRHIHFSEVSAKLCDGGGKEYFVAANGGYVLCVTGRGKTVQRAREKAYSLIDKIVIPKMFYRNDIGLKFIERDKALLKKWGYL